MATKEIGKRIGPAEDDDIWQIILSSKLKALHAATQSAAIADGTTDGQLQAVTATTNFKVAGQEAQVAATDDLWDLSGETDTGATEFRAYWLLLEADDTPAIGAGANAASEALALAALPVVDLSLHGILGVYVAGVSTDFNGAAGLAAQGTIYNGIPAGAFIGMENRTYLPPDWVDVHFQDLD